MLGMHRRHTRHSRLAFAQQPCEPECGEGATPAQKAELIKGVTELLQRVLNKNPATTFVVIDEVALEDWGVGGLPVDDYRKLKASGG